MVVRFVLLGVMLLFAVHAPLAAQQPTAPVPGDPAPGDVAAAATAPEDPPPATQQGLGKPAPYLDGVEWVQGKPVKRYTRGTIYVIDFFVTWSGLSRDVMAWLRSLRVKHKADRVVFVSVAIWPRTLAMPAEWMVKQRPDLFEQAVARDKVGDLSKAWDAVIELQTIPRAVVVDRVGKVAWSGHPWEGLEAALDAVVADDATRLAAAVRATDSLRAKTHAPEEAWSKDTKHKIWRKIPEEVDALLALDRRLYAYTGRSKYIALAHQHKKEEAKAWGQHLVDELLHDSEGQLDSLAWFAAYANNGLDEADRDLDLALAAAQRAYELSGGRDWSILDTLALVHFRRKEYDQAIATATEAVKQSFSSEQRRISELFLQAYIERREPEEHARPNDDG